MARMTKIQSDVAAITNNLSAEYATKEYVDRGIADIHNNTVGDVIREYVDKRVDNLGSALDNVTKQIVEMASVSSLDGPEEDNETRVLNVHWSKVTSKPNEYPPAEHEHEEYAGTNHTHSNYSTTNHTHNTFNNPVTISNATNNEYGLSIYKPRTVNGDARIRIGASDSEYCTIGYNRGSNTGAADGCTFIRHVQGSASYSSYEQTQTEFRFIRGNITVPANDVVLGNGCIRFQNTKVANDYGRIKLLGSASNAGELEIATADDTNEPIHVRQYSGNFATVKRTLTLLDGSGNTSLPGDLTVKGTNILTQLNNHTHAEYASVSHNHDEYYTKEEVDNKIATLEATIQSLLKKIEDIA